MLKLILILLLCGHIHSSSPLDALDLARHDFDNDDDTGLGPIQMIEKHGYPCESHYVTTEDGYIINLHRIPHGRTNNKSSSKLPVYLMHGLLSSSADWVNMGPNRSLGFILADAGYDVWIGNARGNAFSKNHTSLNPHKDAKAFWNFTWHEIGIHDLPVTIDYILEQNGHDDLYYVGHSQGTTVFLVLESMKPEYNLKIRGASLLAPAAIMEHPQPSFLTFVAKHVNFFAKVLEGMRIYEVPFTHLIRHWGQKHCKMPEYVDFCVKLINTLGGGGPDEPQLDKSKLSVITTNAPSSASMKQHVHYAQQIRSGGFSQFDFGTKQNLAVYGTEKPPAYDFSKITTPVAVFYGINDDVVNYQDVVLTSSKLPNLVFLHPVQNELFNHIDFIFAKDVKTLVYDKLMEFITLGT